MPGLSSAVLLCPWWFCSSGKFKFVILPHGLTESPLSPLRPDLIFIFLGGVHESIENFLFGLLPMNHWIGRCPGFLDSYCIPLTIAFDLFLSEHVVTVQAGWLGRGQGEEHAGVLVSRVISVGGDVTSVFTLPFVEFSHPPHLLLDSWAALLCFFDNLCHLLRGLPSWFNMLLVCLKAGISLSWLWLFYFLLYVHFFSSSLLWGGLGACTCHMSIYVEPVEFGIRIIDRLPYLMLQSS